MLITIGCSGSSRQPISGTVTLDGKPLKYGTINFRPDGHAASGSGGIVLEGNFEIPGDKGLPPGNYKVNVQAFKETGRMIREFPGDPERPERRPVRVNEAGSLEVTVGGGAKNQFEFQLTTKSN